MDVKIYNTYTLSFSITFAYIIGESQLLQHIVTF